MNFTEEFLNEFRKVIKEILLEGDLERLNLAKQFLGFDNKVFGDFLAPLLKEEQELVIHHNLAYSDTPQNLVMVSSEDHNSLSHGEFPSSEFLDNVEYSEVALSSDEFPTQTSELTYKWCPRTFSQDARGSLCGIVLLTERGFEIEDVGLSRLSKLSSLVHAFASAEGIEVLHFTCFPFKEQTVYLFGLSRGFEVPFKKWLEAQNELKVQSRKNRVSGVVAYQEVTPEVLSKLYPYNVVAGAFKDSEEDLFRVSPTKLKAYLKDKTTKQMREDIKAVYFKGIPILTWAEKQGISKAAMYMRLDRYTEQFAKDQEQFMFGK